MKLTVKRSTALATSVVLALAALDAAAQDAPWHEPSGSMDAPPTVSAGPPPKQPPKRAVMVEVAPRGYVASDPVSGWGSALRLIYSQQRGAFYLGVLTPGAQFTAGALFNPFGGLELMRLSDSTALWLLGPRGGAELAAGAGFFGFGVNASLTGVRASWCGPECLFLDLRLPQLDAMAFVAGAGEEIGEGTVTSVGFSLSGGVAF